LPPEPLYRLKIEDPISGTAVDLYPGMRARFAFLNNPLFWDKKIRIAILTLATFMALC
jgi:hypothetical protein